MGVTEVSPAETPRGSEARSISCLAVACPAGDPWPSEVT